MKKLWKKLMALTLALLVGLAPMAQAITPDQLKELLSQYYIEDLPQQALDAETVDDIIKALNDPYTMYLNRAEYQALVASMSDTSIVGIGISGTGDEAGLRLVGVYDGSPAQKAGFIAGDIVITVDGRTAAGQTLETISGWLRGEEGTTVSVTVRHENGQEETKSLQRAQITIPATTTELLEDGTTGYIQCTTFGPETLGHMTEGTQAYDDANLWVVDLRNNGGGDVYAVTQTLGVFLGEGTMVYLRDGQEDYYRYVSEQDRTTLYPAIVLTSGNTASSAEIFSLAVKDKQGGMIIGSNTFGKGVAQIILSGEQLPDVLTDGDALRITAYQYYGVDGNTAQHIGVIPDLLVPAGDADEVALLFTSAEPVGNNQNYLRLHLGGWRWYMDLDKALTAENAPYFAEMLSAVPPGCDLFRGTGRSWEPTTAAQIAADTKVAGYTPRVFSDVAGQACEKAANTLCTYGMLRGYGDGSFRPDQGLTRAELCALLVQAMNLPVPAQGAVFSDVQENSWYAPYIQAAVNAGYLNGVGGGRFAPQGKVTHEQMITVLGRLAAQLNTSFRQASRQVPAQTKVPAGYSSWSEPWAWLLGLSQRNIFGQPLSMLYDDLENIPPRTDTTRGEVAQVLYTILSAVEVLTY